MPFDSDTIIPRPEDHEYLTLRTRAGNAIRAFRLKNDMTQTELASRLKCSQQYVQRAEDIKATDWNPRLTDVGRIMRALGLKPEDLFGDPMT